MEKLFLILFSFVLLQQSAEATIWRVNSDGSGDFTAPQAAHDAASAGDTLHLESAPTTYANLYISKQIVVIGKGHSLDDNLDLQARSELSVIGIVGFSTGSDGSKIYGLNISSYVDLGVSTNTTISNITISRNTIPYIYFRTGGLISNVEISHNVFYGPNANTANFSFQFSGIKSNIMVTNNLFLRGRVLLNSNISGTFINNVLASNSSHHFDSFVVRNNIAASSSGITFTNSIFENNIGAGTQFGSANNNQQNVNMSNVFDTNPILVDNDATLKAGSPAIGAGIGGIDCGIFGGNNPYKLSGIPGVPTIYNLSGTVSGNNLQINVSTRSNN